MLLGVNVDHIATIRQQRYTPYPSPLKLALLAEQAGADLITMHLREDRRHIQEIDVREFMQHKQTLLNLEMAATKEMLDFACSVQPEHCCLVPEKRTELTTEGGLDVACNLSAISDAVKLLSAQGIEVSLFIDPCTTQIDATIACHAPVVELHTGTYAQYPDDPQHIQAIIDAAQYAVSNGLVVNAGHGLHYHNMQPILAIAAIREVNIGHAIIAHALAVGIHNAVIDMLKILRSS